MEQPTPDILWGQLGLTIVEALNHAGFTRKTLADWIDADPRVVTDLTRGRVPKQPRRKQRNLQKIYDALAAPLEEIGKRAAFIEIASAVGIDIDLSAGPARDRYLPIYDQEVLESLRFVTPSGRIEPPGVRTTRPILRALSYNGGDRVVIKETARLAWEIETSSWRRSPEAHELRALLAVEKAHALIEARAPRDYSEVVETVNEAREQAEYFIQLDEHLYELLTFKADLALGIGARIVEEQYAFTRNEELKELLARMLDGYEYGKTHPLMDAAQSDVIVDRAWARAELVKLYGIRGMVAESEHEFVAGQSDLTSLATLADPAALIVPVFMLQARTRAIMRNYLGGSQEAEESIREAKLRAQYRVNDFAPQLDECELLLSSTSSTKRDEGRERLQQLKESGESPTAYQNAKMSTLGNRFNLHL